MQAKQRLKVKLRISYKGLEAETKWYVKKAVRNSKVADQRCIVEMANSNYKHMLV